MQSDKIILELVVGHFSLLSGYIICIENSIEYLRSMSGAGTFGTVKAGVYKPKNGGPPVDCAIKALKPMDELPNQKVS